MTDFALHRAQIELDISAVAHQWGRHDKPMLMAVSKMQELSALQKAVEAGQRLFGENRVQEAYAHWVDSGLREQHPDIELHLIGPLQSNKTKQAVALFDVIQTLDRISLADALAEEMAKQQRVCSCFIQVNTGDEKQKAGVSVREFEQLYRHATENAGLQVTGLMCIPPAEDLPAPHFALLANLGQQYRLPELSMGMSADYRQAIPLGATIVRVGTALFGARPHQEDIITPLAEEPVA